MLALVAAIVSMCAQDLLGTFLVVAESRGRGVLAGAMDAGGDLARQFVTIYAAGLVIKGGWTPHAIIVLAAVMGTSFVGTTVWTGLAHRVVRDEQDPEVARLTERLDALEQTLHP